MSMSGPIISESNGLTRFNGDIIRYGSQSEKGPDVLGELTQRWKTAASNSRKEASRIRRTVKQATDAEARCNVRAEVWDRCADELAAATRDKKS
jgi:hypothetical protein